MREIKFRGKVSEDLTNPDKYQGMWIIGDLFHTGDTVAIAPIETEKEIEGFLSGKTEGKMIPTMSVIPESVGQFTGRKNENGQKVYEGDILKDDTDELGLVQFGKLPLDKSGDCVCTYQAFYIKCFGKLGQAPTFECENIGDWMEVVGNETDNPELLE